VTTDHAGQRHTNRLANESSPYLLQHAHNPVDWFAWGNEALNTARTQDKPIFLSIGYAACHWCHVMERESFEDEATADQLNRDFVSIKVDREERPDLDAIYMDAVQAMTGSGGWPLNVFLTPEGKPFYGGTYFPDQPRHGLPSLRQVLSAVADAWRERRSEIESAAANLAGSIAEQQHVSAGAQALTETMLDAALLGLERTFDAQHGGWGRAPKFPQPMTIEFLLARHVRTGDARPLAMARRSLDAMAAGGIYDQLGGGFARYSTDERWLVPHFEKMLYDNALLARAYLHAWQLTGEPRYRQVADETLAFMQREMLNSAGAFISSLDADTDGVEGASYTWAKADIERLLGPAAATFCAAHGVTEAGNFEGANILSRVDPAFDYDTAVMVDARRQLLAARQQRPQPGRDDKVLAAWNGLAVAAFADAARATGRRDWAAVAVRAADALLGRLHTADGRLLRTFKDAGPGHQAGVLEDYTHLADGLLALYQATFDERWLVLARQLADHALDHFADATHGFFDTADDHETLIARPRSVQDNAQPSGGAMASQLLLRLAALTGEGRYRTVAEAALVGVAGVAVRYPTAFAHWLSAVQLALVPIDEIAIIGARDGPDTQALLAVVNAACRPFIVLAAAEPGAASQVELLRDRPQRDGQATAYVCHGLACQQPVTEPAALDVQLSSAGP
jgi:uncharacterized protein YyaL (SSP411 family)